MDSTSKYSGPAALVDAWDEVRLTPDIKPYHYHLWLFPNLVAGTFSGRVTISVDIASDQSHVIVHSKGLNVIIAKITSDNDSMAGGDLPLKRAFVHEPNEVFVFLPEEDIAAGKYKLFMQFEGKLTNKIVGFYRSTYKDIDDKERFIATSKFEPTFARQAFPCFDEPGFKAPFDIEIVKPAGNEYIALSNMEQQDEYPNQPRTGLVTVKFATTKPMSTYLACFIVCDFKHAEENVTEGGFSVNVFARRAEIENIHYAKRVAVDASNFYLRYFNVPYPLSKLDLIAIPDFVSGAMENWGLITFRETRLLCNTSESSVNTQLDVALTVSHEIAHMWFGDLVTMKWWNDLWLNEGFATFIEYKAVDNINPTWDIDGIFIIHELFSVLTSDCTLSSHPIIMPVDHPDQITEIFDSISYSKGASVIRMLENTISRERFQTGIHNYLEEFQYRNAETNDLWSHLNEAADNINVRSFMDTWTLQMGFPVINVALNREAKTISFSQKRFLLNPDATFDKSSSPFGYRWEVPITYITSMNPRTVETAWIRRTQENITVPYEENGSQIQWLKVNFHHYGYYIVNYELSMWTELNKTLRESVRFMDPSDRASLIFDAFNLAEANQLPYPYALDLLEYLKNETHYVPWAIGSKQIHSLRRRLYGTPAYDFFETYVKNLISSMGVLTWEIDDGASYLQKSYQTTLLELGCTVGYYLCVNQVVTLFKQWLDAPAMKLHPELANIILRFGVENTDTTEWNRLWEIYVTEDNPQEKQKMMRALCSSKDPTIIKKYLQEGKNENYVRSQDYLSLLIIAARHPIANPLIWDFVRNEWEFLVSRYTLNDRYLGRVVPEVSASFSTETRLMQMKEFFAKYPQAGAGKRGRELAIERVENNVKWRSRYLASVTNWLNKKFDLESSFET